MGDTFITFHGWVGNEVTIRNAGGVNVANFRVAATPRIKRKGEWMDGETTWYSVSAWRALADNVNVSVKKGDAVIVHGRLRSEHWRREDGQVTSTLIVEASYVGHDLSRGTSVFLRSSKSDRQDGDTQDELAEMMHRDSDDTTQVDSWGRPVVRPASDGESDGESDAAAEQEGESRSDQPAA